MRQRRAAAVGLVAVCGMGGAARAVASGPVNRGVFFLEVSGPVVTNQPAALSVSGLLSGRAPRTARFSADGRPIPGCGARRVAASHGRLGVGCHTRFAAAAGPRVPVAVRLDALRLTTTVTVRRASTTLGIVPQGSGSSVRYTVTISPRYLGPAVPTGTVAFRGTHGACPAQPVRRSGHLGIATCRVPRDSFDTTALTVTYRGDRNFRGSSSHLVA